jgi:hypothetical protein
MGDYINKLSYSNHKLQRLHPGCHRYSDEAQSQLRHRGYACFSSSTLQLSRGRCFCVNKHSEVIHQSSIVPPGVGSWIRLLDQSLIRSQTCLAKGQCRHKCSAVSCSAQMKSCCVPLAPRRIYAFLPPLPSISFCVVKTAVGAMELDAHKQTWHCVHSPSAVHLIFFTWGRSILIYKTQSQSSSVNSFFTSYIANT